MHILTPPSTPYSYGSSVADTYCSLELDERVDGIPNKFIFGAQAPGLRKDSGLRCLVFCPSATTELGVHFVLNIWHKRVPRAMQDLVP